MSDPISKFNFKRFFRVWQTIFFQNLQNAADFFLWHHQILNFIYCRLAASMKDQRKIWQKTSAEKKSIQCCKEIMLPCVLFELLCKWLFEFPHSAKLWPFNLERFRSSAKLGELIRAHLHPRTNERTNEGPGLGRVELKELQLVS